MDTALKLKKLDLVQRLMSIWEEARLERVAKVIEQEVPELEGPITEEEMAELGLEHGKRCGTRGRSSLGNG